MSKGAFTTGEYINRVKEVGFTEEEIKNRIDEIFQTLFYGNEDERLYHESGDDMAWFEDTGNQDARTEGMSYAMMMCVQTDHHKEFDRLWKWARTYMYLTSGPEKGYFAWSCQPDGRHNAEGAAPDGEEFFAMSLFFASHRWGDGEGVFNYSKEARDLLHNCIHKGSGDLEGKPMWNNENHLILFVSGSPFTDPSYHLPHFYELFSRWAYEEDREFFEIAAKESRKYLQRTADKDTGLYPEYGNFDGSGVREVSFSDIRRDTYYSDAYRTIMNIALDSVWFGSTPWAIEEGKKLQSFFCGRGSNYEHEVYDCSGNAVRNPLEPMHPVAMIATNAAATLLTGDTKEGKDCLRKFLNTSLRTGKRRYYDNCLYFFAYLALSGNYRIYT
jgi:oligosaccharide reducing-end xylanase